MLTCVALVLSGLTTAAVVATAPGASADILLPNDPNGHEEVRGLLDGSHAQCGRYLWGGEFAGAMSNPANYDYGIGGEVASAFEKIDHRWVQDNSGTPITIDMGFQTDNVDLIPSIDHGAPIPGEAIESTVYASDDPTLPLSQWTVGDISTIFIDGPTDWVADDYSQRWSFPSPHRFFAVEHGGPKAMLDDGDNELDAMCSTVTGPPPAVSAVAGPDQTVPEGSTVTLDGSGSRQSDQGLAVVPATSNIWAAGQAATDGFDPGGGGPGVLPQRVAVPTSGVVRFSGAAGLMQSWGGSPPHGPDGGLESGMNMPGYAGISGYHDDRHTPIVGVFLDAATPAVADVAPPSLDFTGNHDFASLAPQLRQVFFIGDGLTSSGAMQDFIAPPGATRLFVGIPDSVNYTNLPGYYSDSTGLLTLTPASSDNGGLAYGWQLVSATGPPVTLSSASDPKPSFTAFDEGQYTFRLTATGRADVGTDDVAVTVTNVAPVITRVESDATATDGLAEVTATFTDAGIFDRHAVTYDWGDGSAPETVTAQVDGTGWGHGFAGHRYATTGSKTVTVTVADGDGGVTEPRTVVVQVGAAGQGEIVPAGPGAALWATATTGSDVIKVTGSNNRFPGRVHTNRDLRISGSQHVFSGGTEYVTSVNVTGSGTTFTPAAVQTAAGPAPFSYAIAEWRPGGAKAVALGAAWHNMSSSCSGGNGNRKWQPANVLPAGVYYVNCNIQVSGSNAGGNVTFVADGTIKVSGSTSSWTPYASGLLFLSGATDDRAVDLSGSGHTYHGSIYSATGGIELTGSGNTLDCGIVATVARVSGSNNQLGGANCAGGLGGGTGTTVSIGAPPLLVPTISHTFSADKTDAEPGTTITYTDAVRDGQAGPGGVGGGASLFMPVELGVDNPAAGPVTLSTVTYKLEIHNPATNVWSTLATTDPAAPAAQKIATLTARPNPTAGVTYPTTGNLVDGTVVPAGKLASWSGLVAMNLNPAQVTLLMDPAQVDAIRNTADLATTVVGVRKIARFDDAPLTVLRTAPKGDLNHVTAFVSPGSAPPVTLTDPAVPGFATITPGQAAPASSTATVPVPAAKGTGETDAAYQARLRAVDGHPLVASAYVKATATPGAIFASQQLATTTRHLPVLTTTVTSPGFVSPGAPATWTITLTNSGSATAIGITVAGTLATGAIALGTTPATLAPGTSATVTATAPTAGTAGQHDASFAVTWSNTGAPANAYGPIGGSASVRWFSAVQPISIGQVQGNFYPLAPSATAFTATPADTPAFSQPFPNIAFNPPSNVVPGNTFGVGPSTTPFTDVTVGVDGNATGTLPAQVGANAAGVGALADFQAVLAGTLTVNAPGPKTLSVIADDGFTLGLGGGATRVSGPTDGTPATTPFQGFSVMGGHNANGSIATYPITVNFPTPGTYSFEIDYLNHTGNGTLVLAVPDNTTTGGGKVLVTGHDSDAHAAVGRNNAAGAQHLLNRAVAFVTDNKPNARLLVVMGLTDPGGCCGDIRVGLANAGITVFDVADHGTGTSGVVDLHTVDFRNYDGVIVASDFGGWLRQDELDVLNARRADLSAFLDGGGGIAAFVEGNAEGMTTHDQYGFLPCIPHYRPEDREEIGNQITAQGVALGFTTADFNGNFFHGSFPDNNCGLDPIDIDPLGVPITLATSGTVGGATLVVPPSVQLVLAPVTGTGSTGHPYTVTGTVTAADHQPVPGAPASLIVTGANPQVIDRQANAQGVVTFTWIGANAGVDVARGSLAVPGTPTVSNQATVTWTAGTGEPPGGTDRPGPTIGACAPADGATVTAPTTITCVLTPRPGTTVTGWQLITQPIGSPSTEQRTIATGTTPTASGTFDPTVLPNGQWDLRIVATGSDGGSTRTDTTLIVDGRLKLGRQRTTYRDMSLPVGGIPIEVLRTYDSLDRLDTGDFGHGWTIGVANFRVQTNRPLGDGGWERFGCGGGFLFVPLCYRTTRPHFATVTWPDGRIETFDFTPAGVNTFFPIPAVPAYTGRAGTTSKLEPTAGDLDAGAPTPTDGNIYRGGFADGPIYDASQFKLTARNGTVYILDRDMGLVSATDRSGSTISVTRDGITSSDGPGITFDRDAAGRIVGITGPDGQTVTYSTDSNGDLVGVTDAAGHPATYTYDHHYLIDASGAGTPTTTYGYDTAGRLTSITTRNGTTRIQPNVDARTETTTSPDGKLTTTVTYSALGDVEREDQRFDGRTLTSVFTSDASGRPLTATDPLGHTTTATYNTAGDLIRGVEPDGRVTEMTYTALGQPIDTTLNGILITRNAYDTAGRLERSTRVGAGDTVFGYDNRNRVVAVTDPIGRTEHVTYARGGKVATVTTPTGTIAYTYDASGRRTSTVDQLGNVTRAGYDPEGNLTSVTDALGHTQAWHYDQFNQVDTATDKAGRSNTYRYDDWGQLTAKTDRNGATTSYTYSVTGQLLARTTPTGTTTFTYDPLGRLTAITNADAALSLGWDDADNLVTQTSTGTATSDQPTVSLTSTFDAVGRPTGVTSLGTTTAYGYGSLGRLATVNDGIAGTMSFGYDAAQRLRTLTRPSGATDTYTYDNASQLLAKNTTQAGILLAKSEYRYNASGLRDQLTDVDGVHSYSYDDLGQLTGASHPAASGLAGESYTYDGVGRRTSSAASPAATTSYDAADRLQGDATNTYLYDNEGNRTETRNRATGLVTIYTWNADHQLLAVTGGGKTSTYRYDGLGRRIEVNDNGIVTRFGYDGVNIRHTFNAANARTATYITAPSGYDNILATVDANNVASYLITDALGTPTTTLTAGGAIASRERTDSFGNRATPNTTTHPYGYTGLTEDATGLTYARARNYDPTTGSFVTEDSVRHSTLYRYGANSPLMFVDPTGTIELATEADFDETADENAHDLANSVSDELEIGLQESKRGVGWKLKVPNDNGGDVTIRVMKSSSQRTNYYRISMEGKGSVGPGGIFTDDSLLTHMPIEAESASHIFYILDLLLSL